MPSSISPATGGEKRLGRRSGLRIMHAKKENSKRYLVPLAIVAGGAALLLVRLIVGLTAQRR